MPRHYLLVSASVLRLPSSRRAGADPVKLAQQVAQFQDELKGMPAIEVTMGANGEMMINDGVTRATRAARLAPTKLVPVEIIDERPTWDLSKLPRVGDVP
jgi:hypothetical protein